jgi:hypothetical protein
MVTKYISQYTHIVLSTFVTMNMCMNNMTDVNSIIEALRSTISSIVVSSYNGKINSVVIHVIDHDRNMRSILQACNIPISSNCEVSLHDVSKLVSIVLCNNFDIKVKKITESNFLLCYQILHT